MADNFNREYINDRLIAENVDDYMGKIIVNLLNAKEGENSQWCFQLVEDDYILWGGMEGLV